MSNLYGIEKTAGITINWLFFFIIISLFFTTGYLIGKNSSNNNKPAVEQPNLNKQQKSGNTRNEDIWENTVFKTQAVNKVDHIKSKQLHIEQKYRNQLKNTESNKLNGWDFKQVINSYEDIISQTLNNDEIDNKFENIPDEAISIALNKLLGNKGVKHLADKREFAKSLAKQMNTSSSNHPQIGDVRFSVFINPKLPHVFDFLFTENQTTEIFMHFSLLSGTPGSTVVYWRHIDTGDIIYFGRHDFAIGQNQSWVSYKPTSMWKTGEYLVSLHSLDNQATLLASSRFSVSRLH